MIVFQPVVKFPAIEEPKIHAYLHKRLPRNLILTLTYLIQFHIILKTVPQIWNHAIFLLVHRLPFNPLNSTGYFMFHQI